MKKPIKRRWGLILLVIPLILVLWGMFRRNQPVILELGIIAESNWEVANATCYEIIDNAIETFTSSHPGVKVHYDSGIRKEDYSEWLSQKILDGDAPDLFMVLSEDFYKFASLKILENIDDMAQADTSFSTKYYYQTSLSTGQYQGSQYALPYETVPTLMFVNKSLLQREGLEVPSADWTWRDLEQIAKAVTKDNDGDGIIDQFATYNYSWKEAAYTNGVTLFNADGTEAGFNDSRMIDAVKFVKTLNDLNEGQKVTQDQFDGGNVAFMPLSFSDYRTYKTYPYKIKKYSSFQWDCITLPAGAKGDNTSEVNTLLLSMNKYSSKKNLAWEFMKLLTYESNTQRQIFEYSQGASVLKYVTGSKYAESILRRDMEVNEKIIDSSLLNDVIENGAVPPGFSNYSEVLSLVDSEITKIIEEEKNIDSSMKKLQRDISSYLKQ